MLPSSVSPLTLRARRERYSGGPPWPWVWGARVDSASSDEGAGVLRLSWPAGRSISGTAPPSTSSVAARGVGVKRLCARPGALGRRPCPPRGVTGSASVPRGTGSTSACAPALPPSPLAPFLGGKGTGGRRAPRPKGGWKCDAKAGYRPLHRIPGPSRWRVLLSLELGYVYMKERAQGRTLLSPPTPGTRERFVTGAPGFGVSAPPRRPRSRPRARARCVPVIQCRRVARGSAHPGTQRHDATCTRNHQHPRCSRSRAHATPNPDC